MRRVLVQILWNVDNTHSVGVTLSDFPALNGNDGIARLEKSEISSTLHSPLEALVDIILPSFGIWSGFWIFEWVAAAVQMDLSSRCRVSRDDQDGDTRSVL